jgi:AhpD family alkylhydroperoxidase
MKFEIPDSLIRSEYKRKFSLSELYRAYVYVPRALFRLVCNRSTKLIDKHFVERLQLAVTEVNGCAACSYAHTILALRQGMSNEEIGSFLNGDEAFVKTEEAKAIMFVQHFADQKGYPEKEAYGVVIEEYGTKKAKIILAAAQVMLAGNMYGIPYSAYHARRKGQPYKDSTVGYELGMQIGGALIIPVAFVHAFFRWLVGRPNVQFVKESKSH